MARAQTRNKQDIYIGDRVRLEERDDRHATVLFVGPAEFAKKGEIAVGLCLDNKRSNSMNDGKVEGTRYFRCKPGHALFVGLDDIRLLDSTSEAGIGAACPSAEASEGCAPRTAPRDNPQCLLCLR